MDTYEKKYNDVLEMARIWYNTAGITNLDKEMLERLFPQLRESEDERIRKEIIEFVDTTTLSTDERHHRWIAYLEKQKEQKPNIELIQRSWYMAGYNDRKFGNEPKWIIKTGKGGPKHELNPKYVQPLADEQKPAEDKYQQGLEATDRWQEGYEAGFNAASKPAEWSEEDERIRKAILGFLNPDKGGTKYSSNAELVEWSNWLKSLRPDSYKNCNSRWKPSEEQMEALMLAIEGKCPPTSYMSRRLEDLYDGLANTYGIDAEPEYYQHFDPDC